MHTDYAKIFEFVKITLQKSGGEEAKVKPLSFRKRSEHIRRVLMWAEKIAEGDINREALLTAALFHDVGYTPSFDYDTHAENSAVICEKYLRENHYDPEFTEFVTYLVRNHSDKSLMKEKNTPLELVLLLEADLLDETGALSVVFDCMAEGLQETQSFRKTYDHLLRYTCKNLAENPMVTPKAKAFWKSKQRLIQDFMKHLAFDLGEGKDIG
jgi:uncharacterized protein